MNIETALKKQIFVDWVVAEKPTRKDKYILSVNGVLFSLTKLKIRIETFDLIFFDRHGEIVATINFADIETIKARKGIVDREYTRIF